MHPLQFLKGVFSESETAGATPSFGRFAFGAIIASVIFHVAWNTVFHRAIDWGALGVFLGAAGAVTYTANKVASVLGAK